MFNAQVLTWVLDTHNYPEMNSSKKFFRFIQLQKIHVFCDVTLS